MTRPADRVIALDFLRGACAAAIAAYHFLNWTYDITLQSIGSFGVYAFFVLSAVALMIRYSEEFRGSVSLPSAAAFYRSRFARIVPLLALIIAIGLAYYFIKDGRSPAPLLGQAALTATGLFALHMPGLLSTSVGAWSLGIEMVFYAAFPIIALLAAAASIRTMLVVFVVLVAAQQVLLSILPPTDDPAFWGQYIMPLTFAPFFAGGLIIFRWSGARSIRNFWLAALLVTSIFAYSSVVPGNLFAGGLSYVILTTLTIGAVAVAYRAEVPRLILPLAVFLGEISYSLYLSHWLAYDLAKTYAPDSLLPAFLLIATAIAVALTYGFERPVRRALLVRNVDRSSIERCRSTHGGEADSFQHPG